MNNEKESMLTETERRNAIKEKYLKISTGGATFGVFGTLGVFAVLGVIAAVIVYMLPNVLPKVLSAGTVTSGGVVVGMSFIEMIALAGSIVMVPVLISTLFLLGVKICEMIELASLDKKSQH